MPDNYLDPFWPLFCVLAQLGTPFMNDCLIIVVFCQKLSNQFGVNIYEARYYLDTDSVVHWGYPLPQYNTPPILFLPWIWNNPWTSI